jgi:hypothetical protein
MSMQRGGRGYSKNGVHFGKGRQKQRKGRAPRNPHVRVLARTQASRREQVGAWAPPHPHSPLVRTEIRRIIATPSHYVL